MVRVSDEHYKKLWHILEKQNGKKYTFEEAREIGDGLIEFFNILKEFEGEADDTSLPLRKIFPHD